MTVILVQSHYAEDGDPMPQAFAEAVRQGRMKTVRQTDIDDGTIRGATGLITSMHLDQIGWMEHRDALAGFLDAGGRWFFNGHVMRSFVDGMDIYRPLVNARRGDLALTRLHDHVLFDGIDPAAIATNRGVAGFYGRGCNPLPERSASGANAVAVTGIGPQQWPIDWCWHLAKDGVPTGQIFSHAGNNLWGSGDDAATRDLLARRVVQWCLGEIG